MKSDVINLMTAEIIQFYQENEINSFKSQYYAKMVTKPSIGILEGEYFLDINTYELYPIMYMSPNNELVDFPSVEIPYAIGVRNYTSSNPEEIEKVVKKAFEAHKWFKSIEDMEKDKSIIYFKKRRIDIIQRRKSYNRY